MGLNKIYDYRLDMLWEWVQKIPCGKVTSYGMLGQVFSPRLSGFIIGKWMALASDSIPWWRVVGKNGEMLIHKRDPALAQRQREKLVKEGVQFVDGCIPLCYFWDPLSGNLLSFKQEDGAL